MTSPPSGLGQIAAAVSAVEAGKCPATFFVHGAEEFLVSEARKGIIEALRRRLGDAAELVSLPGAAEDLRAILTELLSDSLFSSDKIACVPELTALAEKGAKAKAQLAEFASRIGAGLPKGKFLVLSTTETGPAATSFAKSLKQAAVLNFPKLKSYPGTQASRDPIFAVVRDFLQKDKKSITPDAFMLLRDSIGTDLRSICSELEKLSLFVGSKSRIDAKDVESIVPEARQQAMFELTEAIAKKNVGLAFRALANLLQESTPPLFVIQSLASQFRFLLQARILLSKHLNEDKMSSMSFFTFRDSAVKDLASHAPAFGSDGTANLLTKSPFVIYKSLQLAARFDQKELAQALMTVSEADAAIKRSLAPSDQLLRSLLFDLLQAAEAPA
ncbi:MAG: DNA polymerase III subunit delta [Candidatus Coatesbacteria bacterium]|nr:DNA polymerase III subunit delta [Candidatus Coatesbacteria bacterium]